MDPLDLQDAQRQLLQQFTEITNITDMNVAIGTLESLDWNLERAIEAHLMQENDAQDDPEIIVEPMEAHPLPQAQRLTAAISRRHLPMEPENSVRLTPQRVAFERTGLQENRQNVHNNFNGEQRMTRSNARRNPATTATTSSARSNTARSRENQDGVIVISDTEMTVDDDDEDDDFYHDQADINEDIRSNRRVEAVPLIPLEYENVGEALQNFIAVFENRYCMTNTGLMMPSFSTVSLPDAIRDAFDKPECSERRPLAIYIHNERSIAANVFVTRVLCSKVVSDLLRHQFVLWPWDVSYEQNANKLRDWLQTTNNREALMTFERSLQKVENFPLILIVTREKSVFTLAQICFGMDSENQVVEKLMSSMETYEQIRMQEQNEKRERDERESIRRQQEKEYQDSLAADTARIEARKREDEDKRLQEEMRQKREEQESTRRQNIANALPSEPTETEKEILHVKFRLPAGVQDMRRFRRNEKISVLADYLSSLGFDRSKYKYFNSDFPKKDVATHFDLSHSFADAKWPLREQIFVEEI